MKKHKVISQTNNTVEHIDFGLMDERGRAVGINVYRGEMETVPPDDGDICILMSLEHGTLFAGRTCITRDQEPYGATQALKYFQTEKEREQALRKKVKQAQARMNRKYEDEDDIDDRAMQRWFQKLGLS